MNFKLPPFLLAFFFLLLATLQICPTRSFVLDIVSSYGFNNHGALLLGGNYPCSDLGGIPVSNSSVVDKCVGGLPKQAAFISHVRKVNGASNNVLALNLGNVCFGGYLFNLDVGLSCAEAVGKSGYDFYSVAFQDVSVFVVGGDTERGRRR